MDIILLTSIVVTLFVVFGIATYREMMHMAKTPYKYVKETGPRADMVNFVGRLFDNEVLTENVIKNHLQAIYNQYHLDEWYPDSHI